MNVLEAIQKSAEYLARRGVESPRLQSEWMLSHLLKLPRLKLYLQFERVLEDSVIDQLRGMVRRRGQREPLQHLLGSVSFCGHELAVSPGALIPRPETELLAERAWTWVESRTDLKQPMVLDLCTGSGCLAILIALRQPQCRVVALDLSHEALDLARSNSTLAGCAGRIEFMCGDLFEPLGENVRFDLIVTNPPYIPTKEIDGLEPEVRQFEPRRALDGGEDGLDFYRRIARLGASRLEAGGVLMTEMGFGQWDAVTAMFRGENWVVRETIEDYHRVPRHVMVARN